MRALLQRVSQGSVSVDDDTIGKIGAGLVVLFGVKTGDQEADAEYLANKVVNLRIFSDSDGKFNLSALDVGADILAISQFTLYADTRRGRRPGFAEAAPPDISNPLYETFVHHLRQSGLTVATGSFGAHMRVHIENDGPVTILLDSEDKRRK